MPLQKQKNKIGLGSFDLIKGYAITAVVLFHTHGMYYDANSVVFKLVKAYLLFITCIMQMFFLVSGYGFKPGTVKGTLKKTFTDLIVPYLWVTAAYATVLPISHFIAYGSLSEAMRYCDNYVAAFLLGNPYPEKVIFGYTLAWNTAAWYFLALFFAFNILNLIVRLKSIAAQLICVVCCVLAEQFLTFIDMHLFCISNALWAIPFCYAGYIIRKYRLFEKLMYSPWSYLVLIPVYSLSYCNLPEIDLGVVTALLRTVFELAYALFITMMGILIGRLEWRALDGLKTIGMHSYWILAIHSAEMCALPWDLLLEHIPNSSVAFLVDIALKATIYVSVCLLLKRLAKLKYQRRIAARVQSRNH